MRPLRLRSAARTLLCAGLAIASGPFLACASASASGSAPGAPGPPTEAAPLAEAPPPVAEAREPRRLSLLIGIGEYQHPHFLTETGARFSSRLTGTTNDVRRMQTTLRAWGFEEGEDQRVLLDADATRQGIAEAFAWLAGRADRPDDVVVVYYSGHGSWAEDRDFGDGVRTLDEEDGYDEALVPWDTRHMNDPEELVLDDEIGHWLGRLATNNVTLFVDSCHSGTASRGAEGAEFPRARGPARPAVATMPMGGLLSGAEGALDHTMLTAAAAHELAYETQFEGGVFGMFTFHLTEVLDAAPRGTATYADVLRQVHARLGIARQTPQLEGDGSAVLFRVHAGTPARAFAVASPSRGGAVGLDVGAVHGARVGAVYDVYPAGEVDFLGAPLAQVRLESVAEHSAEATVLDGEVPAGGRAVLARVPHGAVALERLPLYVDPSAAGARAALGEFSRWVDLVPTEAEALAVLRRQGGAPEGGAYEVLVHGERVAPLRSDYADGRALGSAADPRGFAGTADALCGPLRRAFSIAGLSLIQQSTPDIPWLELRVLPAAETPPLRPPRTAADTAYVGRQYTVWAWVSGVDEAALRTSDVFLSAAIGGYVSEPVSVWPMGSAPAVPLNPDQANRPLALFRNVTMSPVTGVELLKVVAGAERFDFRQFMSRLPTCAAATRGRGPESDAWTPEPPAVRGWAASERRVEVLPAP